MKIYLEVSVLHLASNISGMQPTLIVNSFGSFFAAVQVAHHDVATAHADLTVTVGVGVHNFCSTSVQRLTDRSETVMAGAVARLRSGSFAHAVTLKKGYVEAEEVLEGFSRHGRGSNAENSGPIQTQIFFDFAEDQFLCNGVGVSGGVDAFDGLQVVVEPCLLGPTGDSFPEARSAFANFLKTLNFKQY